MIDDQSLYKTLGMRLRALREQAVGGKRLTQAELASQVGLERTSITNIEKGAQKVPLHVLYRICEVLNVPLAQVLPSVAEAQGASVGPALEEFTFGEEILRTTPLVKGVLDSILNTRDSNG